MGLVHKSELQLYFQDSYWLTRTPGFSHIFSRDDYLLLRSVLHFVDDEKNTENDKLFKIRPILDEVKDRYCHAYSANKELSVDESMLKFKGRLFFKQYMPSKPSTKWGIKIWSLCDSHTGFLLKFDVYTGKQDNDLQSMEHGLSYKVVTSLLNEFKDKGHVVHMDSFFSSLPLFDDLHSKKIGACGTVRANRKGLPQEIKTIKANRGTLPNIWLRSDKKAIACSWQDTGKVNVISTVGNPGVTSVRVRTKKGDREVSKPTIQVTYNKFMGGVDKFDQLCTTYPFQHSIKNGIQHSGILLLK